MTTEEFGAYVIGAGYAATLVIAIKAFGIRRVLWFLIAIVVVAFALGLRTLGAITSSRRH
jgi:hypothetical protein